MQGKVSMHREYTVYMTVVQNKLNKEQAKTLANNLASRIEQEMTFVDRVVVNNIRKKQFKGF